MLRQAKDLDFGAVGDYAAISSQIKSRIDEAMSCGSTFDDVTTVAFGAADLTNQIRAIECYRL